MKELIEFLEKKGLKKQADSLRKGGTELDLFWHKIGDTETIALAEVIADNSSIRELVLGNNQIGNSGVIALAKAINNNNSITYLNLSSNQIEDVGVIALAKILKNNSFITYLDLRFNQIGDAGTKVLAEALKYNTFLITLALENNQIGDESILEIINEYIQRNQTMAENKAESLNAVGDDLYYQEKYSEAIEKYKAAIEITAYKDGEKLYKENKINAEKKYKEQQTKLNQSIIVNKVEEHTKNERIKKDLKNNDSDEETAQLVKNLSTKASISDKQFDILVENKFIEQNTKQQDDLENNNFKANIVNEIIYDKPLLNHPKLLQAAINSKLSSDLIQEEINNDDGDLILLAGLMRVGYDVNTN